MRWKRKAERKRRDGTNERRPRLVLCVYLCLSLIILCSCASSEGEELTFSGGSGELLLSPAPRPSGGAYRIAVVDHGPGESSSLLLNGFVSELRREGWIQAAEFPFQGGDTPVETMVQRLGSMDLGPLISFDGTCYLLTEENRGSLGAELRQKAESGEIDLILAMGTSPGLFVKDLELSVPTLVTMATDPVASGIVESPRHSGSSRIWALSEPDPLGRQLRFYDNLLQLETLQIIGSQAFAAVDGLSRYEEAAEELGIDVRVVKTGGEVRDDGGEKELKRIFTELVKDPPDAVLLLYGAVKEERAGKFLRLLRDHKIPVLISDGASLVEEGALICVSSYDYEGYGEFCAKIASSIFNGKEAGALPCEYMSKPYVAFNMDTAKKLGFPVSFDFLLTCDRIFVSGEADDR